MPQFASGAPSDAKIFPATPKIRMIHVRLLDGRRNFQCHSSKLVDSHFTRFPRRLFFLWPTISPRTCALVDAREVLSHRRSQQ